MADSVFGLADRFFTILRTPKYVVDANGKHQEPSGPTTIATDVPIMLRPLAQVLETMPFGVTAQGKFLGYTASGTDIQINDVLKDQDALNADGTNRQYRVDQAYDQGGDYGLPSFVLYLSFINING